MNNCFCTSEESEDEDKTEAEVHKHEKKIQLLKSMRKEIRRNNSK
jgi:hypothetical protein